MAGIEGLGCGSGTALHFQIFEGICEQRLMSNGKAFLSTGPLWAQEGPETHLCSGALGGGVLFPSRIPSHLFPLQRE